MGEHNQRAAERWRWQQWVVFGLILLATLFILIEIVIGLVVDLSL